MAHFAEIKDGIVQRIIVADQKFIESGVVGDPKNWVETFKDRSHKKNYASIGYEYHEDIDAFAPPAEYASWVLNRELARYEPPTEKPVDGKTYEWDEKTTSWKVFELTEIIQ